MNPNWYEKSKSYSAFSILISIYEFVFQLYTEAVNLKNQLHINLNIIQHKQ